jgi:hypothetical protein
LFSRKHAVFDYSFDKDFHIMTEQVTEKILQLRMLACKMLKVGLSDLYDHAIGYSFYGIDTGKVIYECVRRGINIAGKGKPNGDLLIFNPSKRPESATDHKNHEIAWLSLHQDEFTFVNPLPSACTHHKLKCCRGYRILDNGYVGVDVH